MIMLHNSESLLSAVHHTKCVVTYPRDQSKNQSIIDTKISSPDNKNHCEDNC